MSVRISIAQIRQHLDHLANVQAANKDQADKYASLLSKIMANPIGCYEALKVFIEGIIQENVSLIISRQILVSINKHILSDLTDEEAKKTALFIIEKTQPRIISFEQQVSSLRQILASIYERGQYWNDAASVLIGIPLETGQKRFPVDYKFEVYLKIVRMYLLGDDPKLAECYINRASLLQSESKDEKLKTFYKLCYAQVLNYRHKFIEAAQRYSELSLRSCMPDDDRKIALKNTLICTIVSSAGKQRSRMLGILYKDERCQILPQFPILEKMYLDRIIRPKEIAQLEPLLQPHMEANTVDGLGTTILNRAMIEHNILSASKIYKNMKIESLGHLLGIEPIEAEKIAGKMICEGNLEGSIDQVDGYIYFKGKQLLTTWDNKIEDLCFHVNHIIDLISEDPTSRALMNKHLDNQMTL